MEVIRLQSDNVDALSNLGLIHAQTGRTKSSIEYLQRAVIADDSAVALRIYLGHALKDGGQLVEAAAQYQVATELDPACAPAFYFQANVLLQLRAPKDAAVLYRKCLSIDPANGTAWINLGLSLLEISEFREAEEVLGHAVKLSPKSGAAWLNLGDANLGCKHFSEAISSFRTGLKFAPQDSGAWAGLGEALLGVQDIQGAEKALSQSLQLQPLNPRALFLQAQIRQEQKQLDQAVEGYRQVLNLIPDHEAGQFNLNMILSEQGFWEEAQRGFDSLGQSGTLLAAGALVRSALSVPVIPMSTKEILGSRERISACLAVLEQRGLSIEDPQTLIGTPAFYLAYQGLNNKQVMKAIASFMIQIVPELAWTAPHIGHAKEHGQKIRIAFISAHLKEHTVGRITLGLISQLNRDQFEVWVLRPSGSADDFSRIIDESADHVLDLPKDFRQARKEVANLELDCIYYPDIGMEPFTYYLAFSRLARFQCVGWGHAETTGIPNLDAFISTIYFDDESSEGSYSESLVRLQRINNFY